MSGNHDSQRLNLKTHIKIHKTFYYYNREKLMATKTYGNKCFYCFYCIPCLCKLGKSERELKAKGKRQQIQNRGNL